MLVTGALPAAALGAAAIAGGSVGFGGLFVGLGLVMALLPLGALVGAEVKVENGALKRLVLFRTIVECPAGQVGSIRWHQGGRRFDRAYEFRRFDGHRIFTLSSFWWSDKDVTRLGQQLGLRITSNA